MSSNGRSAASTCSSRVGSFAPGLTSFARSASLRARQSSLGLFRAAGAGAGAGLRGARSPGGSSGVRGKFGRKRGRVSKSNAGAASGAGAGFSSRSHGAQPVVRVRPRCSGAIPSVPGDRSARQRAARRRSGSVAGRLALRAQMRSLYHPVVLPAWPPAEDVPVPCHGIQMLRGSEVLALLSSSPNHLYRLMALDDPALRFPWPAPLGVRARQSWRGGSGNEIGEENSRLLYERSAASRPTHALRPRQLRDEVKSGGNQHVYQSDPPSPIMPAAS